MSYTLHDLEPFTYYRKSDFSRAFLLANICDGPEFGNHVVLLEFGKDRNQGIKQDLTQFLQLLNDKKLVKFIPKIK